MSRTGAITDYIDVAQVILYAFWIFFAGLIIYLRREDKREGYPLESDRSKRIAAQGFPALPKPKRFAMPHGGFVDAPRREAQASPRLTPSAFFPGAPLLPVGDPMQDAVGPAAYAERASEPDRTIDGEPLIMPLRRAVGFKVAAEDTDPRGMSVHGADRQLVGSVSDIWVDRAEPQIRYLEVTTSPSQRVLLPIHFCRIDAARSRIDVRALLAHQFAKVPQLANPDQVTRREEDRICAYYAGGHLYATPARAEPLL